jgi:uncharacterized protein (DUF433 family)
VIFKSAKGSNKMCANGQGDFLVIIFHAIAVDVIWKSMPKIEPPDPKAQPLFHLIVQAIESGRIRKGDPRTYLSYSEALSLLGHRSPGYRSGSRLQKVGLTALNEWTLKHAELPKIAALIVNKKNLIPSPAFAQSNGHGDDPNWVQWWQSEAARAVHYDWSPYLQAMQPHRREEPGTINLAVRESGEEDAPPSGDVIVVNPLPAHIRETGITVDQVLRWMAAGQSEKEIIRRNPGVQRTDIRAALAYAANREKQAAAPQPGESRLSTIASRWAGGFKLPAADPTDAKMSYLVDHYLRHRE